MGTLQLRCLAGMNRPCDVSPIAHDHAPGASPISNPASNRKAGIASERRAERHLVSTGYRTLARNLRVARDELDLVMLAPDRQTVVLVEVKSSTSGFAAASALLDRGKRMRVARALGLLETLGLLRGRSVRVDAIFVNGGGRNARLKHHRGRTLPPRGS